MHKIISDQDHELIVEFHGRNITILKEQTQLSIYVDVAGKKAVGYKTGESSLFHPDNYIQLEIKN